MSRWLITGAAGMLGRDLATVLLRRGELVTGLSRADLDITDAAAVGAALGHIRPEVVVNCAAWTAVDDAETSQDEAMAVNGEGPAHLAACCAEAGSTLVHLSTDYVFSGDAAAPYAEDDPPAPRTAYGRTKLAGEQAVLGLHPAAGYVLRTAWLYGAHGPNFVSAMIRLAGQQAAVDVVADQRGQPTWTVDVAGQITGLVTAGADPGVYHVTSSGETTWHGLAREVFRLLGTDPDRVRAVSTAACPRPAPRPGYSVLGHARHAAAGVAPISDWRAALHRAWPSLAAGHPPAAARSPAV
ncbi:MAG TPA: dTDP-4-dehydrorhamnose reductase [Streptosporangiaceae bacterium]